MTSIAQANVEKYNKGKNSLSTGIEFIMIIVIISIMISSKALESILMAGEETNWFAAMLNIIVNLAYYSIAIMFGLMVVKVYTNIFFFKDSTEKQIIHSIVKNKPIKNPLEMSITSKNSALELCTYLSCIYMGFYVLGVCALAYHVIFSLNYARYYEYFIEYANAQLIKQNKV